MMMNTVYFRSAGLVHVVFSASAKHNTGYIRHVNTVYFRSAGLVHVVVVFSASAKHNTGYTRHLICISIT